MASTVDLGSDRYDGIRNHIRRGYAQAVSRSGGRWYSYVTITGAKLPLISERPDIVIHAASTNKLAMAVALLDKIDRRELALSSKLELTRDAIHPDGGGGVYHLQPVHGDHLTLANIIISLVLASDDTAVQLIARVLPGAELNSVLEAKGFEKTRVEPDPAHASRFFHGVTTPRETHALLSRLADRTLLAEESCEFLLNVMTWSEPGYTDGVRRNMGSHERRRVATKYGAYADERHEVGIILGETDEPISIYAFFADGLADEDNYGATHPAVNAHAALGRDLFDAVTGQ